MKMKRIAAAAIVLAGSFLGKAAVDNPSADISNGLIHAKIYLPDATHGFYQGTRFDWAGVIFSLQANGHDYYGPWFNRTDPAVHDFVYRGSDIVAGACSATAGPVDEFAAVGYDEAKGGGTFLKIGVGLLRKPDDAKYDNYRLYEIANGGRWNVEKHADEVRFTQTLQDEHSGYSYTYVKTVRLLQGKAEMLLSRSLKNTGRKAIDTDVYNHNFLVLDHQPTGPDFTITLPFAIQSTKPPQSDLAQIKGRQIVYSKKLEGHDTVTTPLEGHSQAAKDNNARIENVSLDAGIAWHSDRPLLRASLWSIRSVIAVEPFIKVAVEPGAEFTWQTTYDYYKPSRSSK